MSVYVFWHTAHATVADFNCTEVENFVKFVASGKMFCYQLKKYLWIVCWILFAKGWGLNHVICFAFAFLVFLICCCCIWNQHYNLTSLFSASLNFHCVKNLFAEEFFGSLSDIEFWVLLHFCTPPRVRVRATVKLSAVFFHYESLITIGGGYESAIAPNFVTVWWWFVFDGWFDDAWVDVKQLIFRFLVWMVSTIL